jgi:hypothetical protein
MAIPMAEIRSRFVRYDEGATLARDDNLRFMDYDNARRYGRVNMGQMGYNAQNPSVRIRSVRLSSDNISLPRR